MLVVTTPTGRIGRQVLGQLVAAGEPVRAVARDAAGLGAGVEVVEGSHADPSTLARALDGAEALFWNLPPLPRAAEARAACLEFARPLAEMLPGSTVRRVVFVSSGGRGRAREGFIAASHAVEELLEGTGVHLRSLRCGSFMENLLYQVGALREHGTFSHPIPGDVALPIVATRDIADRAVALLRDRSWLGQAGSAVHGPVDLSFDAMAEIMTSALGRPIRYREVPPEAYAAGLVGRGMSEGFARGYIDMCREIAEGVHAADPRTPESTTPTTFESWCRVALEPALR